MVELRKFGDFATFKYGKMPDKKKLKENGKYPVYSGYRYVGYYEEFNTEANQIIVVARGVGGTGDVKLTKEKCYLTNLSISANIDESIALPEFIYYYYLPHNLRYLDSGSAQSQITISDLEKVMIQLPSLDEQRAICGYMRMLDRKIEINSEVNKNLEQQAEALFHSLFVENANPTWKDGVLSDLGTVVAGGTPSKTKPEYYSEQGIAWITPKDLSLNKSKFISHGEIDISELGFSKSSATQMPTGTVLFSSRAPIGYIAIAANEVTTNQGFKSVVPNENVGTAFIYYLLKFLLPTIEGMASGSTFKEISGAGMKSVPVVIPDNETIEKFNAFCTPIFQQQEVLEAENSRLIDIRDALLPKLMSGELDVSDIDL